MSLYRIKDRSPNYKQSYFNGSDLKGLAAYGADQTKAGYVVDILVDETDAIVYLVLSVRSGLATWFGDRKKAVLPAAFYLHSQSEKRVSIPRLSQNQIKSLPQYDSDQRLDEAYEAELRQATQQLEKELSSASSQLADAVSL